MAKLIIQYILIIYVLSYCTLTKSKTQKKKKNWFIVSNWLVEEKEDY